MAITIDIDGLKKTDEPIDQLVLFVPNAVLIKNFLHYEKEDGQFQSCGIIAELSFDVLQLLPI